MAGEPWRRAAAETVAVSEIPSMRRPDALPSVLQELGTARALGIADIKAARSDVQRITRPAKPPGERLQVLTIGISDNGDKAKNLRLKFADKDARDVASALLNTQGGGLYAEVKPMFLSDDKASWDGIFAALAAMERYMAAGTGQDLAIVMFSGHGTVIDGQFYLLPYGVDDSTSAHLKSSAILATEFQSEISKLAAHGRVLVLLDACRSARMLPNADKLRSLLDVNNVTVLTSSMADKVLREDEKWRHGAFTKVLLDALSAIRHRCRQERSDLDDRADRLCRQAPEQVDRQRSAAGAGSTLRWRYLRCRAPAPTVPEHRPYRHPEGFAHFPLPHGRTRSRTSRRGMQKFRRACRWACADILSWNRVGIHKPPHCSGTSSAF